MKLSKKTLAFTSAGILALCPSLYAQDIDNRPNIYLGGVRYLFDEQHNVKNDTGSIVGFEMPVSELWSLQLEHWDIDTEFRTGLANSDAELNRFGINYHLPPPGKFQPYVGIGIGRLEIKRNAPNINTDVQTYDFGAGVKGQLTEHILLRGDLRTLILEGDHNWDFAFSLSLAYAFGSVSPAPVAPTPTPSPAPTPAPTPVPQAPLDTDRDGVFNSSDSCPNTLPGRTVNNSGCEYDADRDGIVDALDNCPKTSTELAVDKNGCPILDTAMMRQTLAVTFATNRAEIDSTYNSEIREFADFMTQYGNTKVVIEGHTDSDGADGYNQTLSENRANAVMNELIDVYGINPSRLSAIGYGESRPTATNTTAAGKAENRRIEAEVSVELESERAR